MPNLLISRTSITLPFVHHLFKLLNLSGTIDLRHSGFVPFFRMSLIVFLLKDHRPVVKLVLEYSGTSEIGRWISRAILTANLNTKLPKISFLLIQWTDLQVCSGDALNFLRILYGIHDKGFPIRQWRCSQAIAREFIGSTDNQHKLNLSSMKNKKTPLKN